MLHTSVSHGQGN